MKWFVKCVRHFRDFRGRASRSEFWYFMLFFLILSLLAAGCDYVLWQKGVYQSGWLFKGVRLLLLLPLMAVQTRRLHDVDRSGWWVVALWAFIALRDLSDLLDRVSVLEASPVVEFLSEAELAFVLVSSVIGLLMFYWFLKPSEEFDNRYGPALWIEKD